MIPFTTIITYIVLSSGLIVISTLSDIFASLHYVSSNIILRCLLDSCTHGLVGVVSMLLACLYSKLLRKGNLNVTQWVSDSLFSGLYACLIDVDHFIAAGSLHLKAATSLDRRPPFHCATAMVVPCFLLLMLSYTLNQNWVGRLACVSLVATVSHHLRDAQRRGLWLWPFGTTPALNSGVYIISQLALPMLVGPLYTIFSERTEKILDKELV